MGTQGGGLCRFDGQDFRAYTIADGLPSNYVNALCEDRQHRLWIGTNAGVAYLEGKVFRRVDVKDQEKLQVLAICEQTSGDVWFGTNRGVFRFDSAEQKLNPVLLGQSIAEATIWAFLPAEKGTWIATDAGAFRADAEVLQLTTKNGLNSNAVRAFSMDSNGRLWIATAGGGISVFDEQQKKLVTNFTNPAWTTSLQPDPDGKMWIGTSNGGLTVYNPKDSTWTAVNEKQGFPHQYVRSMTLDNSGNVWVGTSGGGVVKFLESQAFTHYGASHGLSGNRVYALKQDHLGRLLLSVSLSGLQVFDSLGIHPFVRDSGFLSGVKCSGISEDVFGRVWVATGGKGILVFDSSGMYAVPDLPNQNIRSIVNGTPGEMWAATNAGIARITYSLPDSFSIRKYNRSDGLPNSEIGTLHTDEQGNLWFADLSGKIGMFKNGQLAAVFGEKDGLPGSPVRCIETEAGGHIWLGTKSAGIFEANYLKDSMRFQEIRTPNKLASDNIYLLLLDPKGNLWAGSESGLDQITFDQSFDKISGTQHFGKNEGFLGIETCQDAALADLEGNLWFGTMNGLMKYSPSDKTASEAAPILHFEEVTLFYKPLAQTLFAQWINPENELLNGLVLPWDQNHLSFEFRAVDLANPDALLYRWKLEGSPNAQWSPLTSQTSVNFAGLQPGKYTFLVQASADGETFSETKSSSFEIDKPFWQLIKFQLLAGFLLLGLILWITRSRIRSIRKSEEAKRLQLELQNHLLQLEQKSLQLQMNPHFLFNALNSIQSLVSAGDTEKARTQIGKFAQMMRGVLNNSRKTSISLKEEVNALEQYLQMEQFCQQNAFEYSIKLPENIDYEEVDIPPMLLQPFVENAVVHGISHLEWPGKIDINFSLKGEMLTCSIRDNGVGREKASQLQAGRNPGHQSVAVQVTSERLEAMKGEMHYEPLVYNDLKNAKGEISGTEVIIHIPIKVKF